MVECEIVLSALPVGLVVTDSDGVIVRANDAFEVLVEAASKEIEGKRFEEFFDGEAPPAPNGKLTPLAMRLRTASGPRSVLLFQRMVGNGQGEQSGVSVVLEETIAASAMVSLHSTVHALESAMRPLRELSGLPLRGTSSAGRDSRLAALTPRQREIASMLAAGKSPKSIARELDVSVHTVRNHLKAIFARLRVRSQLELTRLMLEVPLTSEDLAEEPS